MKELARETIVPVIFLVFCSFAIGLWIWTDHQQEMACIKASGRKCSKAGAP